MRDTVQFDSGIIENDGDPSDLWLNSRAAGSTDDFRLVCDRSLAGIYVIQDGRIQYANAAFAQILDRELAAIAGMPPIDFVHPDDRADVEKKMRRRSI